MANLTYSIPIIGNPDSTECPKVNTALTQIMNWGNGLNFQAGSDTFTGNATNYITVTVNHSLPATPVFAGATATTSTYPGYPTWGGVVGVQMSSTQLTFDFGLSSGTFSSSYTYSFVWFAFAT